MIDITSAIVGALAGIFTYGSLNRAQLWLQKRTLEKQKELAELEKRREELQARNEAQANALIQMVQEHMKRSSLEERLRLAMEISAKQAKMDVRLNNEQQLAYNELELEKLSILRSILNDGHDPVITVRLSTGAGSEQMLLSSYVNSIQKTLN